ncbi:hypothetical protein FRP1_28850 (plasmid) [Pseudonocardia sp. EC080625-04]|nr:hypothetical protein FRP1_28850 [Pseudonocardia sp. EC080625-04]
MVELDSHFLGSVRDWGVRQPLRVRRRASDGVLVVREGQRRTLAAVRLELSEIPVIIEPEPATENGHDPGGDEHRAAEIDRIVAQLTENQHRSAITDAEEVAAHQQLLALSMTPAQISRATRTKADRVRRTTRVAASERATAIGVSHGLDLLQLSVIAEFDDDAEATEVLTGTAANDPTQFGHVAQRLRDARDERVVRDAAIDELVQAGTVVVNQLDENDPRRDRVAPLTRLRATPQERPGTAIEEADHRTCPGHAATVTVFRHFSDGHQPRVSWVCTDPDTHGHATLFDRPNGGPGGPAGAGEESEEDREARRAALRRVKKNNKAWDSAETVRRDWLRAQLSKKTAPKGAAAYVAAELGQGDHDLRRAMESGNTLACQLLGLEEPSGGGYYSGRTNPIADAAAAATPARAGLLSLAVVLAAHDSNAGRNSWRNPMPATQRYFTQLQHWGYVLSPVEQLVLDPDADTDFDDTEPDDLGPAEDDPADDDSAGPEPVSSGDAES